jgi:hypothetical protein
VRHKVGAPMRRDGYFILQQEHPLFPSHVQRAIESRAAEILEAIEKNYRVSLDPLKFTIYAQNRAGRSPSAYVRWYFTDPEHPDVRIILTQDEIDASALAGPFAASELLVIVVDAEGCYSRLEPGPVSPQSCRALISVGQIERFVEDVIIDVTLGNFFRSSGGAVAQLINEHGLHALFRRKVEYARDRAALSWLGTISKDVGYAVLSSLNRLSDDDIEGRGRAAWTCWLDLISRLSLSSSLDVEAAKEAPTVSSWADLESLAVVGGSLPVRRMRKQARQLPQGDFTVLVLRRSSRARKSPFTRDRIRHLFGKNARINSFVMLTNSRFVSARAAINDLATSGHVTVIRLKDGMQNGYSVSEEA